jgi:Yip1 domain
VVDTIAPAPTAVRSTGLASRLVGVLTSPRAVYAEVAARPRWLGAFLVAVLVSGAAGTVFMATEVGQRAVFDQQIASMEASGRQLSDAQMQTFEGMLPYYKYFALLLQLVTFGLGGLVVAGLALAAFNALLGGDASFKQMFAVVAHSGVVLTLGALCTLPLDYLRESVTSPTSLTVFLPMLEENTFPARLLGAVDLFRIWWTLSLAIGLGVLYRRRTGPIATTLLMVYGAIAVVYAAVMTAL